MKSRWFAARHAIAVLVTVLVAVPLAYLGDTVPAASPIALRPAAAATGQTDTTAAPQTHRVTLITGDVVEYSDNGDGQRAVAVHAAPRNDRAPVVFHTIGSHDDYYVIPSDVQPYLASGAVDQTLFNVAELIRQGLTDAQVDAVPVLVRYQEQPGSARMSKGTLAKRADALPGTDRLVPVQARALVGMQVAHDKATEFWSTVAPAGAGQKRDDQKPGVRAGTPANGPPSGKLAGIARLALDRTMQVALDESVPMVGAPSAWAAGLDGQGITVGVVDTGIDATHSDLAGKILDSANFTWEPDTVDRHGHGTHVASIIAGAGDRYHGVAPGAKLVIAKVFDAGGFAPESQIMAGMEWAANNGAQVVNMSLGGAPTDGTDEVSALVNDLTAQTGALFVISSGNLGGDRAVTSPGSATSALTVGAVDKQDHLATFSSRGPRLGDAAVKPEIVAPGVSITAARAAGTGMGTPVNDSYTSASGTSMAAPHVAGGAAILLQQHPQWSAQRLKDALVSTAKDNGQTWFQQGAGRLDVARVVTAEVTASAAVNVGQLVYGGPAGTATATYHNDGASPVTLQLALSVQGWNGQAPPEGTAWLSDSSVTVPAGGSSQVTVTVDPGVAEAGVYGGVVTADLPAGTALRTPVSWYVPAPSGPITVNVRDSQGQPITNWFAAILNESAVNDPLGPAPLQFIPVSTAVSVPQGSYTASSVAMENSLTDRRWTALIVTEVEVGSANTSVTLDARNSVPVGVTTPEPTDQRDRSVALRRHLPGMSFFVEWQVVIGADAGFQAYVTPAPAADVGTVSLQDYWTLAQRQLSARASNGTILDPAYDASTIGDVLAGYQVLSLVWAADGSSFSGIDVQGKVALVGIPDPGAVFDPVGATYLAARQAATNAAAAGAKALVVYSEKTGALSVSGLTNKPLPQLSLDYQQGTALRAALPTSLQLNVLAKPGFMYNVSYFDDNGIPADHIRMVDRNELVLMQTRYHADKPDLTLAKQWTAVPPVSGSLAQRTTSWTGSGAWAEYIGPADARIAWQRRVQQRAEQCSSNGFCRTTANFTMFAENVFPAARVSRSESWFRAPLRNGAVTLPSDHPVYQEQTTAEWWQRFCGFCRGVGGNPDRFVPAMEWMDSHDGHLVTIWQNGRQYLNTTTARLYHHPSGVEIPMDSSNPFATFPIFQLPAGPGRFRLHQVDQLPSQQLGGPSQALSRTATRTDTTWVFSSQRPAEPIPDGYGCGAGAQLCAFQPLLLLDYQLNLGLDNSAQAGRPFRFLVRAQTHPGAEDAVAAAGLTMQYSTNDGASWRLAQVSSAGLPGWYLVTVSHPPLGYTDGYVWLKARAWDQTGNWVDQTVQRAYALAG